MWILFYFHLKSFEVTKVFSSLPQMTVMVNFNCQLNINLESPRRRIVSEGLHRIKLAHGHVYGVCLDCVN